MSIILYLLFIFQAEVTTPAEHAIYLSTIEVNIQPKELTVLIKVFEDDLRDALRSFHGRVTDTTANSFNQDVAAYFSRHLVFKADGVKLQSSVESITRVGDSYQVKMIPVIINNVDHLHIHSDYFMELFPTQQNILNMSIAGKKKYYIFKKGKEDFETNVIY